MLAQMTSGLELFVRYCDARSRLYHNFNEITEIDGGVIYEAKPHSILDIFEFLYMLSATEINSGNKIAVLANAHNRECERLLGFEPAYLERMSLNKTKIREAIFSDKNIKKLRSNFEFSAAIDQSDIARLLFKHMSRETVRKVVILFDRAGLVKRIDAGDSVLIRPNGKAEHIFEQYLVSLMLPSPPVSEEK